RRRRRGARGILGPGVLGVAPHKLLADRRVVALPEAGEISGDLNGALVRGEQVERDRDGAATDARTVCGAEEVLEPGGERGRLAGHVLEADAAPARQRD